MNLVNNSKNRQQVCKYPTKYSTLFLLRTKSLRGMNSTCLRPLKPVTCWTWVFFASSHHKRTKKHKYSQAFSFCQEERRCWSKWSYQVQLLPFILVLRCGNLFFKWPCWKTSCLYLWHTPANSLIRTKAQPHTWYQWSSLVSNENSPLGHSANTPCLSVSCCTWDFNFHPLKILQDAYSTQIEQASTIRTYS
jgi:hypothetical protein